MAMLLSELFRKHIQPHHKVLCVGPYDVENDPSPVMASVLTHGNARGRVWLLDRQSNVLKWFLQWKGGLRRDDGRLRKPGKPLKPRAKKLLRYLSSVPTRMGIGDVASYADGFGRKYGEWLKRPVWRIGNALKMPFTPGKMPWSAKTGSRDKFDVLIDAGSFYFIRNVHTRTRRSNERVPVEKIWVMEDLRSARLIRQYKRVSHKTIIMAGEECSLPLLKQFAVRAEAKTAVIHNVISEYIFAPPGHPPDKNVTLVHDYPYNKVLVIEW
mgnify:FL=1